ncbi:MAG TPA: amino acid ABC transporter permease [Dongiaceae bacterium]|jgi:polar amino acid transport system permease protein|nr:amino acid ABC transporter permease [Dongiaceae bacterium]
MRPLTSADFVYLLNGLKWTIGLSFSALILGGIIAAVLVTLRLLRSPALNTILFGYVSLFQGTPLLGQLLFFYFGLSIMGLDVPPFVAATAAMSFYSAAFLSEIWRGSVDAIQLHQWEASESLGLSRLQTLANVILPQAMRSATPPTVGFLVQLIKDSSLATVLGFVELTRAAQLVNNATFRSFTIFGTIAVLYFILCFPIALWSRRLERNLAH